MEDRKQKLGLLKSSPFFKDFDQSIIEAILPLLQECHFNADNPICMKGDESDCLYLIDEGQVEVSVSSRDGKVIVLGSMAKGDVFGEIGLLDKGSRTASVSAKSYVHLYKLTSKDFTEITKLFTLREWEAVTTYVCRLFRRVTNNLEETTFLDTSIRIVKKILEIYDKSLPEEKDAEIFKLNISQEVLGRMVGLSREATNKTLSRLSDEGLIESKYKHILVPDIARLRQMASREET